MTTGCTPRNYQSPYNSSSLLNHLAGGTATSLGGSMTVAVCLKITPAGGVAVGYTSHTRDLSNLNGHSGVTFKSSNGMMPTTVDTSTGLTVPNVEIHALLASTGVSELQWLAGAWSNADFEAFIINYEALQMGDLVLLGGNLGQGKLAGALIQIEGLGFNQRAQLNVGDLTKPTCRVANFANERCGLNKATWTRTGTVWGSEVPWYFVLNMSPLEASGFFDNGEATCTGGANSGLMREIKVSGQTSGKMAIELKDSFPYPISAGDSFSLVAGCNRRIETCGDRFNNAVNFDGEPYIPGLEKAYHVTRA